MFNYLVQVSLAFKSTRAPSSQGASCRPWSPQACLPACVLGLKSGCSPNSVDACLLALLCFFVLFCAGNNTFVAEVAEAALAAPGGDVAFQSDMISIAKATHTKRWGGGIMQASVLQAVAVLSNPKGGFACPTDISFRWWGNWRFCLTVSPAHNLFGACLPAADRVRAWLIPRGWGTGGVWA